MRPGSTLQGLRGMLGAAAARLWRTMWSGPAGGSWDTTLVGKAYAEFTGCMIFHFIGSVASSAAAANSVALMVLVYYTAKISGGHLNPSVTLTFTLLGHTNPVEMLVYWAAQIAGCIAGGLWVAALVPQLRVGEHASSSPNSRSGCVSPQQDLTDVQVFGWEAVATFCFLVPVFSVVWYTQQKSGYGNTGPIMVGLALYAVALAAGDWSGAFVNPARVLGSHAVFNCDSTSRVPYYVAGQLLGACVAPFVIVPWYGLASNPWYFAIPTVRRWLLGHQPDAAATATSAEDLPPVVLLAKGRANSIDLGSGVQTSRLSMPSSQSPIQAGNLSAAAASSALTRGSPEKRYRCVVPELATSRRIRLHSHGAAGFDLHACEPAIVPPGGARAVVDTGVAIGLPHGTYGRIAPRSGLAVKNGIAVGAGVVDADYRGTLMVVLFNHGSEPFSVAPGDRIAQLILERFAAPNVQVVHALSDTLRGVGGFGSTGV